MNCCRIKHITVSKSDEQKEMAPNFATKPLRRLYYKLLIGCDLVLLFYKALLGPLNSMYVHDMLKS